MHYLNKSTIGWNDEQFWIKFAYYGQFGELQKRSNISIININDTNTALVEQSEKIKLIDITFLILVVLTIVFVFVTLTIKVLCQRLNDKDIDIDIEYLQTLSRNIAPPRTVPFVPVNKPYKRSINKSMPKFASRSGSLPSHKTGPMSVPVQSSSSYSTAIQPTDQDKSSSDLRLELSTLKGKVSFNPSKQSVILPVNESEYFSVSKVRTETISLYSKSLPEAQSTSKQSFDIRSTYPLSSRSFDNQSEEARKMSLGLSREDFISVLSDRDSFEMDIKSQQLRSKKSKIETGLDQNSKRNVSNSIISHPSVKDNLEKSSYRIEKSTTSVKKPSQDAMSKLHRDSYSRISKFSKNSKIHREIKPQALLSSEPTSKLIKVLPPRGSWKSTQSIIKNVNHNSPKHEN